MSNEPILMRASSGSVAKVLPEFIQVYIDSGWVFECEKAHMEEGGSMSDREELALILVNLQRAKYSLPPRTTTEHCSERCWAEVDSILAAGYRKPYPVNTVADLDALPIGSVVRSSNGTVYERDHVKTNPGDTTWWMGTGSSRDYQSSSISLPATVIYEGDRE